MGACFLWGRGRRPQGSPLPAATAGAAKLLCPLQTATSARPAPSAVRPNQWRGLAPPLPRPGHIGLGLASPCPAVVARASGGETVRNGGHRPLRVAFSPPHVRRAARPQPPAERSRGPEPPPVSFLASLCPRRAGAMRLGPRPATLGLLLLCAAAASAGDAEELHYPQGEHRSDYDREALLGGQVRWPGRGLGGPGLAPRLPRALSRDKEGRPGQAWSGRPDNGVRAGRRSLSGGPRGLYL